MRVDGYAVLVREIVGFDGESNEAVAEHGAEVRSVEGNLFEGSDGERRQNSPEKCCTARPAGDQDEPAIDGRVPECGHDEAVEELGLDSEHRRCTGRGGSCAASRHANK